MKKLAAMTFSIVLIGIMAISGSLAYFTDTVISGNNVITAGSVQVQQIELQRNPDATGDVLIPYQQNQPCFPVYAKGDASGYVPSKAFQWNEYVTAENAHSLLWDEDKLVGSIDKFVFVKNIGTSPAYCRTLIAFECPDGVQYGTAYTENVDIVLNLNADNSIQWNDLDEKITIDGTQYQVKVATYLAPVKAGETALPSLLQIAMSNHVTNQQVMTMGDTYEVLVLTQACQTTTFIDAANVPDEQKAANALDTCFDKVTRASAENWFNSMLQADNAATGSETGGSAETL
ncbi:MAG: hypothetical protein IJA90_01585 [Peptococcaceae bacterium]|nr:hypothetical protein [Peptococcaceae bacterium]